jgi:hypothetical protein
MPWTDHIKYADVGDKLNYAAVLPGKTEKDPIKFVGWIRKFCVKHIGATPFKAKKKEIGL